MWPYVLTFISLLAFLVHCRRCPVACRIPVHMHCWVNTALILASPSRNKDSQGLNMQGPQLVGVSLSTVTLACSNLLYNKTILLSSCLMLEGHYLGQSVNKHTLMTLPDPELTALM